MHRSKCQLDMMFIGEWIEIMTSAFACGEVISGCFVIICWMNEKFQENSVEITNSFSKISMSLTNDSNIEVSGLTDFLKFKYRLTMHYEDSATLRSENIWNAPNMCTVLTSSASKKRKAGRTNLSKLISMLMDGWEFRDLHCVVKWIQRRESHAPARVKLAS